MFILELHNTDGIEYVGPFPTADRAAKYAEAAKTLDTLDSIILPLIVPYAVVKKVEWR